jgi:hypothetical protein
LRCATNPQLVWGAGLRRCSRSDNGHVRAWGKVLVYLGVPLVGTAAGGYYRDRVLQPVPAAVACPGPIHDWRCTSYKLIVSKPSFVVGGALIGIWLAYALVRLYSKPGTRIFTWQEAVLVCPPLVGLTYWIISLHPGFTWIDWGTLRWDEVLLFLLAAVLARLAIGIASIAEVRGGLLLAFGLPLISTGVGYAAITVFRAPPVGHSCPPGAISACQYHPLIGQSWPWMILGLLVGLWLAYAVATDLVESSRPSQPWIELAVVLPVTLGVIYWALVVGPQQAGSGDVRPFLIAVGSAVVVRLFLAERTVQYAVSEVFTKVGMVSKVKATAS